jgi:hypothetical protein
VELAGGAAKSVEKAVEPAAGERGGQGEAEKKTAGHTSHGSDIAQRASEAFPADRIGRMLVTEKVGTLEEPVASENGFVPGPWPKEGGIVANSKSQCLASSGLTRRGLGANRDLP